MLGSILFYCTIYQVVYLVFIRNIIIKIMAVLCMMLLEGSIRYGKSNTQYTCKGHYVILLWLHAIVQRDDSGIPYLTQ